MTIRLILVTHASTPATASAGFPDDEPLDPRGLTAAREASGTLRRFAVAWRGPERRCAETSEALGLSATAHPALADLDLGSWRGRTLTALGTERPAELGAWLADPEAAPHGGETVSGLVGRVAGWLGELSEADSPEGSSRVVAVTHPAVVRAAVLHVMGAPANAFWRLDAGPLTQTWLSRHGGRWQLRETGHPL